MAESSYDLLFSKLPRARLFNDYYAEAGRLVARALLQPPEDRNVDICAQVNHPGLKRISCCCVCLTAF